MPCPINEVLHHGKNGILSEASPQFRIVIVNCELLHHMEYMVVVGGGGHKAAYRMGMLNVRGRRRSAGPVRWGTAAAVPEAVRNQC